MENDIITEFKQYVINYLSLYDSTKFGKCTIKTVIPPMKGDFVVHINSTIPTDAVENMKNVSRKWHLIIQDITVENSKLIIFLERLSTFQQGFKCINASSRFEKSKFCLAERIHFSCDFKSVEDLTGYRINLLTNAAKEMASVVDVPFSENANSNVGCKLYFTHKSNVPSNVECNRIILCGVVRNAKTKIKESNVTVSMLKKMKKEVIARKMEDNDKSQITTVELLTEAVLKFSLLRVKSSSPIVQNFESNLENSDDIAVFVMYNYSRLNSIMNEFTTRVKKNYYPPLPPINSVDFGELKEEKEWHLFVNYVLNFSLVVSSCIKNIDRGEFFPHLLCNYLHNMSRAVSSYYRSTKVLMDYQPHLFSLITARMYLIKELHHIFDKSLRLLGIEPVPAF